MGDQEADLWKLEAATTRVYAEDSIQFIILSGLTVWLQMVIGSRYLLSLLYEHIL